MRRDDDATSPSDFCRGCGEERGQSTEGLWHKGMCPACQEAERAADDPAVFTWCRSCDLDGHLDRPHRRIAGPGERCENCGVVVP